MRYQTVIIILAFCVRGIAAEPLHTVIDREIASKAKADTVDLASKCDDAEFLRRIWLDLASTIPTSDYAKDFLNDKSTEKRLTEIDKLLADPRYAANMANRWNVHLMERLGDHKDWQSYLTKSFADNKPWDKLVSEILRADHAEGPTRGSSFFIAKRLENYGQNPVDYSALTRDVGRLFLGKNFQCAECHDHLFIDDYKQKDFQGLHAFFRNTALASNDKLRVVEKPILDKLSFASVFTKVEMQTFPALPGGMMIAVPTFAKGEEYAEKPDRKTNNPGVPKFSTLKAVSVELPTAKNRAFVLNAVNRIWFMLMGRGLVHQLDLHTASNPPSHPALLNTLADEFVAHKFDMKWLIREICLSETYQRSSVWTKPGDVPHARSFAVAQEKRLTAEQLCNITHAALGEKPNEAAYNKFQKAHANQAREPEDDVEPSLKAALFVLHDETILNLLKPKPGNRIEKLASLTADQLADELYLSALTRLPTAEEKATVAKVHAKYKSAAAGKLLWALLASMEFGVNH